MIINLTQNFFVLRFDKQVIYNALYIELRYGNSLESQPSLITLNFRHAIESESCRISICIIFKSFFFFYRKKKFYNFHELKIILAPIRRFLFIVQLPWQTGKLNKIIKYIFLTA